MQKKTHSDNIIAQITPIGTGAVAGLRLSGPDIKTFAETLFSIELKKTRYAYFIKSKIDELILIYYKAPSSYTGEDVLEVFSHGNQHIVNAIIDAFINTFDIRVAKPGEFTKRAFLNSKLDLVQAESIVDLINTNSSLALENQLNILKGSLSNKYLKIKNELLDLVSQTEFEIEFEETNVFSYKQANILIRKHIAEIEGLLTIYSKYKNSINEVLICIVGSTNVGKSSLFNKLINEDRAIVHETAGTTRDYIEAKLNLKNYKINLVDTAGLRISNDSIIENIGIDKTKELIDKAAFLIEVFDNDNYTPIRADSIYIRNKIDLKKDTYFSNEYIYVSCKTDANINSIYDKILAKLNSKFNNDFETEQFVSLRQYEALAALLEKLNLVLNELSKERGIDIISVELANSIDILNEILGTVVNDEILDNLFSKFCVGK